MQSRFWMDKIKSLSPNHVFVQKSRWPYSMQSKFICVCLAGAVANVADSDRCCNPKVPSSIPAGGKDFP